jgi:hypothetical protein
VIEQVTKHLMATRLLHDGTQRAVLHLTPDHLGSVRVTVDVKAGLVRVGLAAGEAALATLHRELGHLKSQLAESGLHLADVSLQREGDQAPADAGTGGRAGGSAWSTDAGSATATAGDGSGGQGRTGAHGRGVPQDGPAGTAGGAPSWRTGPIGGRLRTTSGPAARLDVLA